MIRTKRNKSIKLITDINITPFTDVCLVLLIIFMVTASALTKETSLRVNLPKSATATDALPTSVTVRITSDRHIFVNDIPVTSLADMEAKIAAYHKQFGTRLLVVRADEGIPYQMVINTIDVARKVGVDQIALATRQLSQPQQTRQP